MLNFDPEFFIALALIVLACMSALGAVMLALSPGFDNSSPEDQETAR